MMYNVTQEQLTSLREHLNNNGISDTDYTDSQLTSMIQNAVTLIGEEYVTSRCEIDYDYSFNGDMYLTAEYPITPDNLRATCDDVDVTGRIRSVTREGVIHFKSDLTGILKVEYQVGLGDDLSSEYVLMAAVYLTKANSNLGGIASINEGDVSVSYDTTNNARNSLDGIIMEIHNQFGARVRMI